MATQQALSMADGRVDLGEKRARLREIIRGYGSLIVAYSGGVDSAFLAAMSHDVLGDRSLAITALSPSVAPEEYRAARKLAANSGWRHRVIETNEMADERYVANDGRRCFFCKNELYTQLTALADAEGFNKVANGANVDDLGDYRPGMDAARMYGVEIPLVEAGLKKADIRALSLDIKLPTWDKPAQPCLSSRIPYGTMVTVEALSMIGEAERGQRELGFRVVRVRHHGETARVEIPLEDIDRFNEPATRAAAESAVLAAGYAAMVLDERGFRSGNLNEALSRASTTAATPGH